MPSDPVLALLEKSSISFESLTHHFFCLCVAALLGENLPQRSHRIQGIWMLWPENTALNVESLAL